MKTSANGILLLYDFPLVWKDANTILEHVSSFEDHSRHKVWSLNVKAGFPKNLSKYEFNVIVLHYSLFGSNEYPFDSQFLELLKSHSASYKIAFFQDEYRFCQKRFNFINEFGIQCVYSCLSSPDLETVYRPNTRAKTLLSVVPGFVSDTMIQLGTKYSVPLEKRNIDIAYRGRALEPYMGKAALEKTEIADQFLNEAKRNNINDLKLDLHTREDRRLYGETWYRFLGNTKAVLGVESGVSLFDLDGQVFELYSHLKKRHSRSITYDELRSTNPDLIDSRENTVHYRTISPRHFEAASTRTCQILFEGEYSGILKPMIHYLPLMKDFSNFLEIVRMFRDTQLTNKIVTRAYSDLIKSGNYHYNAFINTFDEIVSPHLLKRDFGSENEISRTIDADAFWRIGLKKLKLIHRFDFPGRKRLGRIKRYLTRVQ
ncbi:MAG: hypothetical protein AABZ55_08470 [Bdellovibrionota bacterium]